MAVDGVAARAAAVIDRIVDDPAPIAERARRILQVLGPVFRYDAAVIALRDPERRIRIPLASTGDASALHAYWSGAEADDRRRSRAPAGSRCAIDTALVTADGRHVGDLTVLGRTDACPTVADRELAGVLAPLIARAVDRLPAIRLLAGIVPDVIAGAVLTGAGNTLPLPELPTDPLLGAGSPVVADVVERLDGGDRYATFLHPVPNTGAGALLRVTALDCRDEVADHLRAAVLLSPAPDLPDLSGHDLQVFGLIVAGWEDDRRIAAVLGSTPEDVAETARKGMRLLGAPSRTGLAVRVLREGLFLPPRTSGAARWTAPARPPRRGR